MGVETAKVERERSHQAYVEAILTRFTINTKTGCWLWNAGRSLEGYGQIWRAGRPQNAHRESWKIFNGSIPSGMWILHRCDIQRCINPKHLYLGNHADNTRDSKLRQRTPSGERHGLTTLTTQQVAEIRSRYIHFPAGQGASSPNNAKALAREFKTTQQTILNIGKRRTWIHNE